MKFKLGTRFLSVFLALVLVFQLLPVSIFATEGTTDEAAPEIASSNDAYVTGEITSLRDEHEKHFQLSDGSFIAVDYGVPVHYALDEETWADIDNTLVLQNTASPATASMNRAVSSEPQRYAAVNGDDAKTFSGNRRMVVKG